MSPSIFNLQGKIAMVTGAGGGLGSAIALTLGELGANLTVEYGPDNSGSML